MLKEIIILSIFKIMLCTTTITFQELTEQSKNIPSAETDSLILAHVYFRHGEKVPHTISDYPTDPNKYASYWPYTNAELTKTGQFTSYKLGLELRARYKNFLGPIYQRDIIAAYTSNTIRTEASLQCVLSGLFQPNPDEMFIADLNWRPVPYDIIPNDKDEIIAIYKKCIQERYFNITSIVTKEILELYEYLSNHTGLSVRNSSAVYLINDGIQSAISLGKPAPSWLQKISPEPLKSATIMHYYDFLDRHLRLGAAGIYRKLIDDTLRKLNGTLNPPRRKFFLYSGHAHTLLYALGALYAYKGFEFKHSSYVSFELHYINGNYGYKVFLQNYENIEPVPISIFNLHEFCLLDIFLHKLKWLIEDPKPVCP